MSSLSHVVDQSNSRPSEDPQSFDQRLIALLQSGLPLVTRPYQTLAGQLGCSEANVLAGIERLLENGVFKRFGVVVRHHELGYCANGMVVWDVPDDRVTDIGSQLALRPEVRLCYRRPRCLPHWPYNLFCMIHGREREEVVSVLAQLVNDLGLEALPHEVLFSTHRFKQRGAHYQPTPASEIAHV